MFWMEFSNWIIDKFIEWRGKKVGNSGSVAEFAKKFGASQQLMSAWMKPNGKVPRSLKYINALVMVYGNEVYEILGISKPTEAELASFTEWIQSLPDDRRPEARRRFNETVDRFIREYSEEP